MNRGRLAVTAALLVLVAASVAVAEVPSELDIFRLDTVVREENPIVLTASRRAEPIDEAAGPVIVVTAEDIVRFGFRTVAEILDALPGMFVDNPLELEALTVRGSGFSGQYQEHVLVLLDGHVMNEPWSEGATLETDLVDVTAIDRIEVVRGPASALYGSNGFFAVVNVITRRARPGHTDVSAALEAGYPLGGRAAATATGTVVGFETSVHAFGLGGGLRAYDVPERAAEGCVEELAYTCTNGRTLRERDWRIGAGAYVTARRGGFTIAGRYNRYDIGLPMGNYQALFNDEANFIGVQHAFGEVSWSHPFSDRFDLTARVFYDWAKWTDTLAYEGEDEAGEPRSRLYTDFGPAHSVGAESRVLLTLADAGDLRERIQIGVTGQFASTTSDDGWIDPTPDDPRLESPGDVLSGAVFAENDLSIGSWGRLVTGARLDLSDTFEQRVSPRAGAIVRPWASDTFKVLYNEGFRNPSPYEEFYHDKVFIIRNPGLAAEVIRNVEVQWTHRFTRPGAGVPAWSIGLGGYYSRLDGLLELELRCIENPDYRDDPNECPETNEAGVQLDDVYLQTNSLGFESYGAEGRLEVRTSAGARLYLNMAVQSTRSTDADAPAMNSPAVVESAGVSIPILRDRLFVAVRGRYLGPRLSLPEDSGGERLPPSALLDAAVTLTRLGPGLSLTLTAKNLLATTDRVPITAEDEAPALAAPGPPRSVFLTAVYRPDAEAGP